MPLNATDVTRVATEAARIVSDRVRVNGVTLDGGSGYSEVLVTLDGCRTERCQVAVGVFRDISEAALYDELVAALRRHLAQHDQ